MNAEISLVIISNNAAATIFRTLQSVKLVVDEIIFIDTGITDNTLEIAGVFNPKIFAYSWDNNFSKARNFGIDKASGKWIFILDSDEYIAEQDIDLIKQAITDPEARAFVFTQKSDRDAAEPVYVGSIRLFKNTDTIRYKYAVHEMPTTGGSGNISQNAPNQGASGPKYGIRKLDIKIEHSGYQTLGQSKKKEKRNLNILKYQLLKEKLNEDELFHYGVYFLRSNLNAAASSTLEKHTGEKLLEIKDKWLADNSNNQGQDFFIFYSVIADFLLKYSREDEIEKIYLEATTLYKSSPYMYFKFAEFFYKTANFGRSIQLLEKCLSFRKNEYNSEQLIDPGILSVLSYSALAKCYLKLDDQVNYQKYSRLANHDF